MQKVNFYVGCKSDQLMDQDIRFFLFQDDRTQGASATEGSAKKERRHNVGQWDEENSISWSSIERA